MYGMELSRKRNPGTLLNSLDLWWMEGLHPLQFMPFCKHTCHEMISRIKILDLGGLLTQDLETLLWQLGNLWFFAAKVVKGNSAYRKETKTRRCCYVLFGSFLFPSFLFQNESFHSNSSISKVPLKKNAMPHQNRRFQNNWISLCGLKAVTFNFTRNHPWRRSLRPLISTPLRSDCDGDGGGGKFSGMIYVAVQECGQNTPVFLIFPTIFWISAIFPQFLVLGERKSTSFRSLIKHFEEFLLSRSRRY